MAEGLARHGATRGAGRAHRGDADEAAAAIGERAGVQAADVSREADVLALRDAVLARHGRIDVLVNNAGINPIFRGIERTSLEDWQSIIDINLTGTFLCCKHLGGAMVEQGRVRSSTSVRWPGMSGCCARCRTARRRAASRC